MDVFPVCRNFINHLDYGSTFNHPVFLDTTGYHFQWFTDTYFYFISWDDELFLAGKKMNCKP